jgi:hypothetical protein
MTLICVWLLLYICVCIGILIGYLAYVTPGRIYRVCLIYAGGVYCFIRSGGYAFFCGSLEIVQTL